ncbi:hypothetical protein [Paenibacillus sp. BJ-4]|uniref:hypothetical protein n=1 Tax=Paenibacillus sp. BJ-4 TaxID=2878097 RepID=UPI001CEFF4F1|nr:hypothetical protein [Paenibacillus sp. BJ-4]
MLTKSTEQLVTGMKIDDYGRLFEQELALNDMTYGLGVFFAKDAYEPGVTYRSQYALGMADKSGKRLNMMVRNIII